MAKRTTELRIMLAQLESIVRQYKILNNNVQDRSAYEQNVEKRLRTCFEQLYPLIVQAVSSIRIPEKRGTKSKLKLEQKVILLLIKQLIGKSNRNMSFMLVLFSTMTGIEVSYKTIERIFSDPLVKIAIYNLHILSLKKKGVKIADAVGDGTGHMVLIGEHYATTAQKLKDKAKNSASHNKTILYFFAVMDIKTRLYVGYGSSLRCEQDAQKAALKMTKECGVELEYYRIDRLFSAEAYCNQCTSLFNNVKYITIPKKNIAHFGLGVWSKMLVSFLENPMSYLKTYYQRNQAESGFAEDKKRTGWHIYVRKEDRIEVAQSIVALWHNLSWMMM